MGLETLPKWGESSPTRMGGTWNPWVSSPIHLETQPNNGYENLIPKGIKLVCFNYYDKMLNHMLSLKYFKC